MVNPMHQVKLDRIFLKFTSGLSCIYYNGIFQHLRKICVFFNVWDKASIFEAIFFSASYTILWDIPPVPFHDGRRGLRKRPKRQKGVVRTPWPTGRLGSMASKPWAIQAQLWTFCTETQAVEISNLSSGWNFVLFFFAVLFLGIRSTMGIHHHFCTTTHLENMFFQFLFFPSIEQANLRKWGFVTWW